jgi:hypothetical protein
LLHIAVSFDVQPERRDDFIAAALEDGRNSGADEPGTQRFEPIGRLALLDDSSGILVALDPANGASPHALVR